jgi:hypothetical protein
VDGMIVGAAAEAAWSSLGEDKLRREFGRRLTYPCSRDSLT